MSIWEDVTSDSNEGNSGTDAVVETIPNLKRNAKKKIKNLTCIFSADGSEVVFRGSHLQKLFSFAPKA